MSAQKIEIIVSPKGEFLIQTKGFTGANCQAATRLIEQALGTQTSEKLTAEFYQTDAVKNPIKLGSK